MNIPISIENEGSKRFVIISGCSGGGKSTLLAELHRRGYSIIEEPGRRIVKQELQRHGSALPWIDAQAFLRRAFDLALVDRVRAFQLPGWVFFDRSLIDAAAGLERMTGELALGPLRRWHRYFPRVFLAPPWPEIYVSDHERRHGRDAGIAEYDHLTKAYTSLGYDVIHLP